MEPCKEEPKSGTQINNDSSAKYQNHGSNGDLSNFDVTFPHEMNLKQFDFNYDDDSSSDYPKFTSEFTKPTELSESLEQHCNSSNFFQKIDTFYEDMMARLKLLKNTPVINHHPSVATVPFQEHINAENNKKKFKFLKNTKEVQEKLKFIQELDDELKSVISDYKIEKEQRLQTQLELCNDICKNNSIPEKNTQCFLDMCHFEFSDTGEDNLIEDLVDRDIERIVHSSTKASKTLSISNYPNGLIKRNIELAKTGSLAGSSLTDEEKSRIEILMETEEANVNSESSQEVAEPSTADVDTVSCSTLNAYSLLDFEKAKLLDIDEKLEKFIEDEKKTEKGAASACSFNDEFLLKKALKRVNEQIKELRNKEEENEDYVLSYGLDVEDYKEIEDEDKLILYRDETSENIGRWRNEDYDKYLKDDSESDNEEYYVKNELEEGIHEISEKNSFLENSDSQNERECNSTSKSSTSTYLT